MMKLLPEFVEMQEEIKAFRHKIHMHPETAYEEENTANFICEKLDEFGMPYERGLGKTGVVATVIGKIGDPKKKQIGLRADIDALNIHEEGTHDHVSKIPGKMHGCGHDGHTSMLLGVANYLSNHREFEGTLYLIFQPAEEGECGARAMIEDGLFEKFPCDEVYGMHNWPDLPLGEFGAISGPVMAAPDIFHVKVFGDGGHAAMPHKTVDPVLIGAHIITALQSIVSRNVDPSDQAVVSVTSMFSDNANNVIPAMVELQGTVRTFSQKVREDIHQRFTEICESVAKAFGGRVEIEYLKNYEVTYNHEKETEFTAEAAAEIVGSENVKRDLKPCMGGEDFSFMLKEKPGSYIWMGTAESSRENYALHHPKFDFNDNAISLGCTYWIKLAEHRLGCEIR